MNSSTKMVVESITLRAYDFSASDGNVDLGITIQGRNDQQEHTVFRIQPEGEKRYADIEAAARKIIEYPRDYADTDDDAYAEYAAKDLFKPLFDHPLQCKCYDDLINQMMDAIIRVIEVGKPLTFR